MKRSRTSYDNIRRWKIVRSPDSYSILPSPNDVFSMLLVVLPFVAAFYWLIHYGVEIEDTDGLLMADCILFGTTLLLFVICVRTRIDVSKDLRPILIVELSHRELRLPRLAKTYPLDGAGDFFIAHDYFEDDSGFEASELNFVEIRHELDSPKLLLHFLGRCKDFDKIGEELAELGVPFKFRSHLEK